MTFTTRERRMFSLFEFNKYRETRKQIRFSFFFRLTARRPLNAESIEEKIMKMIQK